MANLILPGLIDPHVHLRDPGQTTKEDFYSGTAAALHGGYTTILDMPNNLNPIISDDRLEEKMAIAKEKTVCDIGFYFGSLGDNLDEFLKIQNNVFGLKLFLNQTTGGFIITEEKLRAIYNAWPGKRPILAHAEEEKVELVIQLAKETGKHTHICHVASKFELEKIIEAKEQGIQVTCGVTPHHLFLTEQDEGTLGSFGKMRPPLKRREDIDFLWKHITAIDVIESDHAPHTKEEKDLENSPNGVPGLETTLPLLLTAVHEGKLSIEHIVALCHDNPARIFHISSSPDTTIEIDTEVTYEIQQDALFTKAHWSPFNGWKVKGKVITVMLHGKQVLKDDKLLVSPGSGSVITPEH